MGVAEQTSNGGSNKPTFSPITQVVLEYDPKGGQNTVAVMVMK